jgi:hypothetical protein
MWYIFGWMCVFYLLTCISIVVGAWVALKWCRSREKAKIVHLLRK